MGINQIGQDGKGVYLPFDPALNNKATCALVVKLFESNQIKEIRIGNLIIRKGEGAGEQALKVYDATTGRELPGVTVQQILATFFVEGKANDPDQDKVFLSQILAYLPKFNLNDKYIGLSLLLDAAKAASGKTPKDKISKAVTQDSIDAASKALEKTDNLNNLIAHSSPIPEKGTASTAAATSAKPAPAAPADAAQTPAAPAPVALTPPLPKPGETRIEVNENGVKLYLYSETKAGQGIEAGKLAGKTVWVNGTTVTLTDRVTQWLDRGGDSEGIANGIVSLEDLKNVIAVVAAYSGAMGMNFGDAFEAYNSASSFRKVSVAELREARTEMSGWLGGVKMDNAADISKALKDKGVAQPLLDALQSYLSDARNRAQDRIAAFLLRAAMASMTGMYKPFSINENEVSRMHAFSANNVSRENLVKWVKGQEVGHEEGGSNASDEAKNKIYRELTSKSKAEDLDAIYQKNKAAIDGDAQLLEALAKGYFADHAYDKLITIFPKLTPNDKDMYSGKIVEQKEQDLKLAQQIPDKTEAATKVKAAIDSFETFVKLLGQDGEKYKGPLVPIMFESAMKLAERGQSKVAMEIAKKIPADAAFQIVITEKYQQKQVEISGLEARFRVAVEADALAEIAAPDKAPALDRALAMTYKIKLKMQNNLSLVGNDYKEAGSVLKEIKDALLLFPTADSNAVKVRDRLVIEIQDSILKKGGPRAVSTLSVQLNKILKELKPAKVAAEPAAGKAAAKAAVTKDKPAGAAAAPAAGQAAKPAEKETAGLSGEVQKSISAAITNVKQLVENISDENKRKNEGVKFPFGSVGSDDKKAVADFIAKHLAKPWALKGDRIVKG
jgi:hypothetical protein